MKNTINISQLLRFGLILAMICFLATLVLAITYNVTKPKIEEQLRFEEQEVALKKIMQDADSFNKKSIDEIGYFEALKGNKLIGYCVRVTAEGYSGFIRMVVGIDSDGVIKGVQVLEHQETPGLGSKINEIRQGEEEPYFLRQFKGRPAETLSIEKNIDAITGATISSKAVTDAINKTISEFLKKIKY